MNKELLMVICVFAGLIIGIIGAGNVSTSDVNTYRLTLTGEGCTYAQSIGLLLERNDEICATQVRFWPNRIGSGGIIILNDDKHIEVSDAMLLAKERSDIDFPPTPEMRSKAKWGIFWICVAGLLYAFGLFIGNSKSRPERKGGEE